MLTYYPWSEEVRCRLLESHGRGDLACLDLDLTAQCSLASCIYCDSRPRVGWRSPAEMTLDETCALLARASALGATWVYCCGLGEPLEDSRFVGLVEQAYRLGMRLSLFTNALGVDKSLARFLRKHRVCLIVKLDTLVEETFDRILGGKGLAVRIYHGINELLSVGYGHAADGATELAFSVVPTKLNVLQIPEVLKYAVANGAFPSIGELERAGSASGDEVFGNLSLSPDEVAGLAEEVTRVLWKGYTRPICPATIAGLHVDDVGNCVVDADTGLNCKWFLLKESRHRIIGNVRSDDLSVLLGTAREYRRGCFAHNAIVIQGCEEVRFRFGGCGGSPHEIIAVARGHL